MDSEAEELTGMLMSPPDSTKTTSIESVWALDCET